jgi:hypothetical protein
MWFMQHQIRHGNIPIEQADEVMEGVKQDYLARQFCFLQTAKFGTDARISEVSGMVDTGPLLTKWFAFYNSHFKQTLTEDEFNTYMEARKNGEDVSEYLPKGDWRDYEV